MSLIAPELLAVMQCPACSGDLKEDEKTACLVCAACGLAYPVRDGIPVMLVDEATPSDG